MFYTLTRALIKPAFRILKTWPMRTGWMYTSNQPWLIFLTMIMMATWMFISPLTKPIRAIRINLVRTSLIHPKEVKDGCTKIIGTVLTSIRFSPMFLRRLVLHWMDLAMAPRLQISTGMAGKTSM